MEKDTRDIRRMSRSLEPITDLSPSYSTKDEENVLTALADYMIEPPPKVKRTGEDIPSPSGSPVCPDFKAQVCSDLKATGANIPSPDGPPDISITKQPTIETAEMNS